MSPKSIKSSTNVGKKLCVKTCLFLTLIFMDFRCILAPKLALKKVGFFEVFLKLAPEGSQEASKRLRKAPKRPPRSDLKRFLLSFWTVLGIVLGKTSRATRYFHHALQPYKRVWEIRSYVLCSFFCDVSAHFSFLRRSLFQIFHGHSSLLQCFPVLL